MKVKQINPEIRGPYFVVEFGNRIAFTDMGEYYEGIFTLGELNTLGQHIDAALQDYDPPKYYTKHPVDSYPDLFYNFGPSSNPDAIIERYDYFLRKADCYPIDWKKIWVILKHKGSFGSFFYLKNKKSVRL